MTTSIVDSITTDKVTCHASIDEGHFVVNGDMRYAGTHLVIELWMAHHLNDIERIRQIMMDATKACGATLVDLKLHQFGDNGGITGVVLLSESHISIHTWPEYGYCATDIFVCGKCDPYKAIPVFRDGFKPGRVQTIDHKRGLII